MLTNASSTSSTRSRRPSAVPRRRGTNQRALTRTTVVAETIFVEGISADGRVWPEVLAALREGARSVGGSVRIVRRDTLGAEVLLRAPLKAYLQWATWAPADLPYDPRTIAFAVRAAFPTLDVGSVAALRTRLTGLQGTATRAPRRSSARKVGPRIVRAQLAA